MAVFSHAKPTTVTVTGAPVTVTVTWGAHEPADPVLTTCSLMPVLPVLPASPVPTGMTVKTCVNVEVSRTVVVGEPPTPASPVLPGADVA